MPQYSAGILLFRRAPALEVLLAHPGGPYWAKKDEHAWSIPKGLREADEDAEAAARREFEEETGRAVTEPLTPLGAFKQSSGKIIEAFALEAEFDLAAFKSNSFELEWPPRSGEFRSFPEADRVAWFDLPTAQQKIVKGQQPILLALRQRFGHTTT